MDIFLFFNGQLQLCCGSHKIYYMKKLMMVAIVFCLSNAAFAQDTTSKKMDHKMGHKMGMMKDCVMMHDGKMMEMKGGKTMEMSSDATMTNGTVVMTDGTVKMKDGKTMKMKDGDCVYMDGKVGKMKMDKPMR
jgi:hypothetical protein